MVKDLVERLRQMTGRHDNEAADALEAKDREIERLYRDTAAAIDEVAALRELLMEAAPMVRSYRRKHERSFEQTSRKLFTEAAEGHAETVGRCDRILTAIDAFRAALKGDK